LWPAWPAWFAESSSCGIWRKVSAIAAIDL
jgi:hypothetical protein